MGTDRSPQGKRRGADRMRLVVGGERGKREGGAWVQWERERPTERWTLASQLHEGRDRVCVVPGDTQYLARDAIR